jgi:DnaJ-class molecular chaperone
MMTAYQVLGLQQGATQAEIRAAYKRLALKWHPDKYFLNKLTSDTASGKFQEISEAYQFLTKHACNRRRTFTNVFDQFFGRRDQFSAPPPKRPKYAPKTIFCASLEVTLEDLLHQRTKLISIDNSQSLRIQCRPAWKKEGTYLIKNTKKQPLVFGNGTPCGADLKLSVTITPHPIVTRRGDDLYRTLLISLKHVLLGLGKVSVMGLDEKPIHVDLGTSIVNLGQPLIIPNYGMPKRLSIKNRGNLLVQPVLDVSITNHLTVKQRELLTEYL